MIKRKPQVAGMFYPAQKPELQLMLSNLLNDFKPTQKFENIFGLVSPHAGYPYSGNAAAQAYNLIEGKNYNNVIVISPSHSEYFYGISIYSGKSYCTPLGDIKINEELSEALCLDNSSIYRGIEGHRKEHALEVQLPFLQSVLNDFELVPIVMGDQSPELINELAESIAKNYSEDTLIVASSDLSHFYSMEIAEKKDSMIEKFINDFNFDGLIESLSKKECEACGGGPILASMKAAEICGFGKSKTIARTNSGDTTGDYSEVVGYLSAVIFK